MKAAFFTIATSLLSTVAADQCTMECCPKTDQSGVAQPCCPKAGQWCGVTYELYGNWLFLQPNGSNLYYAAEAFPFDTSIAVPEASPNWKIKEIDPDYHSGFEVGAVFLFRNTNIDIKLNWERLHGKDSASASTTNQNMFGPFFDIGPNSAFYNKSKGHLVSHFDGVNLIFGKRICFFNRLYMNFGAGLGFARIKQDVTSSYSNDAQSFSRTVKTNSKFTGGGPEIALNYDYRIYDNLFFTGNTDISLFMGEMENSTQFISYSPQLTRLGIPQPNKQKTSVPDRAQLVPGLEQKLGLSYVFECKCAKISIAAGYQCQIYINGVQSVDMTAPQVLPALLPITPDVGVFAVGFQRTLSNYILTGPYASLAVAF